MLRILIVGSQHGNELLGERLFAYIQKQPISQELKVEYVLANPRARKRGVRLIESDMNRSFGLQEQTYESRRAARLLAYILTRSYDLVLDAHTTTVNQAPCLIVHSICQANQAYLSASFIKNIVVMKHEFVQSSLIGQIPHAVSVEVSASREGPQLFHRLHQDLLRLARKESPHRQKNVFAVDRLLERDTLSDAEVMELRNFTRSKAGYYPVLVGEAAYKKYTKYLGFMADTKERLTLLG